MHDVSNAINILDPSKTIDAKICGTGQWDSNAVASQTAGKCHSGGTSQGNGGGSNAKLSDMFTKGSGTTQTAYPGDANKKMSEYSHTSAKLNVRSFLRT